MAIAGQQRSRPAIWDGESERVESPDEATRAPKLHGR